MDNPFEKRATEYISDPRSLLPLVSPDPVEFFFAPQNSALFEKLTMWVGTPGCGKTTIARILEFDSLWTLSTTQGKANKELAILFANLGVLEDGLPTLLAHCIPMNTNFRSIAELPYSEAIRNSLLRAFVQSKAVLGWLRQLERANIKLEDVEIILRDDSDSARELMQSDDVYKFREYARKIEFGVFSVVTALVPPDEATLAATLNRRFDIFEDITGIKVNRWPGEEQTRERILRPMVVIDDAHELHPSQFMHLREWLKTRVIKSARWMMCRIDVVPPEDYRDALTRDAIEEETMTPGSSHGRDYYVKLMQTQGRQAKRFRKVAADIADRYLTRLPSFAGHAVRSLSQALGQATPSLSKTATLRIQNDIDRLCNEGRISQGKLQSLAGRIPTSASEDERLATLRILLNREINNTPQMDLLAAEPITEEDPEELSQVKAAVIDGARIQLMHEFDRPYYYGIEKLADSSNSNIEQFISLAGPIVDELLTKIIRRRTPEVTPLSQHHTLQKRARDTISEWDFPYHDNVKTLVDLISKRCLDKTLLPYAPLDDGANAFGVPQEEMDEAFKKSEKLARVLHFAFAYKALVMHPQYNCKGRRWCLLELGGIPILATGLPLSKGGFVEGKISDLEDELSKQT